MASYTFSNHTTIVSSNTSDSSQLQKALPIVVITNSEVRQNDVLCGRGQGMYNHPGNGYFRELVEQRRHVYLNAAYKCEKRLISGEIVQAIHSLNPGGRFLARLSGRRRRLQGRQVGDITWYEVSYDKAREKACQSLRERAPPLSSAKKAIKLEQKSDRRTNTPSPSRTLGLVKSEGNSSSTSPSPSRTETLNAARATSVSPVPDSTFSKAEIDLLIAISEHPLSPPLPSEQQAAVSVPVPEQTRSLFSLGTMALGEHSNTMNTMPLQMHMGEEPGEAEHALNKMAQTADQQLAQQDRRERIPACPKTNKAVTQASEESWLKVDSRIDWIDEKDMFHMFFGNDNLPESTTGGTR